MSTMATTLEGSRPRFPGCSSTLERVDAWGISLVLQKI